MRSLSTTERTIIEKIASKIPETLRAALLSDLDAAFVTEATADGKRISFFLQNYERPAYRGQHSYGVEGQVSDVDGNEITVILYADEKNHLLELEFIKWDEGCIKGLNLESLKLY